MRKGLDCFPSAVSRPIRLPLDLQVLFALFVHFFGVMNRVAPVDPLAISVLVQISQVKVLSFVVEGTDNLVWPSAGHFGGHLVQHVTLYSGLEWKGGTKLHVGKVFGVL